MKTKSDILIVLYQLAEAIAQYEKDGVEIVGIEMASNLGFKINEKLNNAELNVVFIEKPKVLRKKMN